MQGLLVCLLLISLSSGQGQLSVDVSGSTSPWHHYWEECVGSGHAHLALREDWRNALRLAQAELGFKYVRFHGLFNDDMSVVLDGPTYSWYNVDSVFDFLLGINMKPFIELSFMPQLLARNASQTVFHYKGITSPPTSYIAWGKLIEAFTTHLIARYGVEEVRSWYFEVWNEPNCGFWSGSQAEYFHLMEVTTAVIHGVDSKFRVGGPATCGSGWIPETMDLVRSGKVKLDFISTHEYPTDVTPFRNDIMKEVLSKTRSIVGNDLPVFYTEYNDGLFSDPPLHDTAYASGFILKNIVDCYGIVDAMSWWTFTDIFEEGGQSSTLFGNVDGWGLLSIYDIPKPSYRAFQILHESGDRRWTVKTDPSRPNVGMLVTRADKYIQVVVWNHAMKTFPISTETVSLSISGHKLNQSKIFGRRIDETHSNPFKEWLKMGSPAYPTKQQIKSLKKESEMKDEDLAYHISSGTINLSLVLAPHSVLTFNLLL